MKKAFVLSLCVLFALSLLAVGAYAKNTQGRLAQKNFVQEPNEPAVSPEIGGSMFQAAAATTVVLGWWQFDSPSGTPTKQGWTEVDLTTQLKKFWHIAGSATGCDAITPIAGTKSMWCGQAATSTDPYCGWISLPGYGNNWDQSLETTVSNVTGLQYAIAYDSEPGYDYTYVEWYDGVNAQWVADVLQNGGTGGFTGAGTLVETLASPYGPTKVRFHFQSDGAWSDQDGLWPTPQGGSTVDNLSINGGAAETFESAACNATAAGSWTATTPPGFGEYGELKSAATVVQQDPCLKPLSNMWAWFDNPAVTNYACGGWPLQGAVPYGPDNNGLYMLNEVWSPWVANNGLGSEYILQFLTYRDLQLSNLVFYVWGIRDRVGATGCPTAWKDLNFVYYGGQKDWLQQNIQVGALVVGGSTHLQVSIGAYDYCGVWGGVYGNCACHSHAPLIDQVKLFHVETYGPQYTYRDIDMWNDNFPELGGISPTSYARCDMAQDIIPSTKKNLVPGDSLKIVVTDPAGLATDNTGGRPGKAVYVFVRAEDRFGALQGYLPAAMESPDNQAWGTDPNAGLLRWPYVAGVSDLPNSWYAYRMDQAYTTAGGVVKDTYCADLMDLAAGPDGPPYHPNENWALNTGIFKPGDVIRYFVAAKNTLNQWAYITRNYKGNGQVVFRTNSLAQAQASAMEWSVLPDKGREPGDVGDILFVDDADDRGGPAQLYFDNAFKKLGLTDKVDRFDVLGPSSVVGNSLAGRVKNISTQIIGAAPTEIYQKVLWNCSDLNRGLMGDGGTPNLGNSAEKSDDFGLANTFLANHPNNPGWAYWGDDVVFDWSTLLASAAAVKAAWMNYTLTNNDQAILTSVISPVVYPVTPSPIGAAESFYAYGGCFGINDFDAVAAAGASVQTHRYNNATTGPGAAVAQTTANAALTTARFFLAGFGFNFIRDNDTDGMMDYVNHLREILIYFQNSINLPTGIDPVAFANGLEDNYPNPFNPTTTIKYSIAERGHVTLKIYNAAGQLVRTLVDENQAPESVRPVTWNGMSDQNQPVASGVYFYQLTAKNFSQTKKMVLLK